MDPRFLQFLATGPSSDYQERGPPDLSFRGAEELAKGIKDRDDTDTQH